jgi:coenzyme F420-reducing hydrogenase beta subunit
LCLALVIALIMCCPCAALEADAGRHDPEAVLLLEEAARSSANVTTLSVGFRQEKKLRILAQPLTSQGYLCVTRASAAHGERLLWAYTSPAPSGFVYENGQGFLWETSPADKRPAGAQEAGVITAIVRHMLDWIQIDAKVLQQTYRLERPAKDMPVLLLHPRRQSFFTKLEVVFAPSLDSVRSLTFFEAGGDTVRILFTDAHINRPLPERCAQ